MMACSGLKNLPNRTRNSTDRRTVMNIYLLNKLVRDNIPTHQEQTGQNPVYHKLAPAEHAQALLEKLVEEAREIPLNDTAEAAKELADVQQALDDLASLLAISQEQIAAEQQKKRQRNGAFKEGLFVESVTVEPGSEWDAYYSSDPERFPKPAA